MEPDIKTIILDAKCLDNQQVQVKDDRSPSRKRVITYHKNWTFSPSDFLPDAQINLAKILLDCVSNDHIIKDPKLNIILRMLYDKLRSYRAQDMSKTHYSEDEFITMQSLMELILRANNTCFYCKETVKLIYEEVRDPKQWTLERIDNSKGHNTDNVELACLACNLRRRTMYHERYILTKQMCNIIKST